MSRPPFPTPYAGTYYPIYGSGTNQYLPPKAGMPFDKVSTLIFAFAHAYPLDPNNPNGAAVLDLQKDQPNEAAWLECVKSFARDRKANKKKRNCNPDGNPSANPNIKFLISLGYDMNDWTYISNDLTSGANHFPVSVVKFLRGYGLDGFDIDDEDINNGSGNITQENFDKVIANIRSALDTAGREDGKPYYLTIAPAFGPAQVTADNIAHFDLINMQSYSPLTTPDKFIALGAVPKQLAWGIDTELAVPNFPSPADYQPLAGIFNWTMSADSEHDFEYTNKIAESVGYTSG